MDTTLEQLVWQRARSRCEYCQLPQSFSPLTHAIDHIIARKHHGLTQADNLALFAAPEPRHQQNSRLDAGFSQRDRFIERRDSQPGGTFRL